jgi:hypothetical protein
MSRRALIAVAGQELYVRRDDDVNFRETERVGI